MTIQIKAYGPLIPVLGEQVFQFEFGGGSASDFLDALLHAYPGLQPWQGRIAVACDNAVLAAQAVIEPDSLVELIPPVSGG